jgi:hypothetical protein
MHTEPIQEVLDGLLRRAKRLDTMVDLHNTDGQIRIKAKAVTYQHAADLLHEAIERATHMDSLDEDVLLKELMVHLHLREMEQVSDLLHRMGLLEVPNGTHEQPAVKQAKAKIKTPVSHLDPADQERLEAEARALLILFNAR